MGYIYDIEAYDYHLPPEQIAQYPLSDRDESRLLLLDCKKNRSQNLRFRDLLAFLKPHDLLVVNDTKVFPARLVGTKETGGRVELLLLEYPLPALRNDIFSSSVPKGGVVSVTCLVKGHRLKPGTRLLFGDGLYACITEILAPGKIRAEIRYEGDLAAIIDAKGEMPLPPYIRRKSSHSDQEQYQTRFASKVGAVAAPTAGLHFSDAILDRIWENEVKVAAITLHVGYGTFSPVREKDIRKHRLHEEYVSVSLKTAQAMNQTLAAGNEVWVVGTTTARALEFAADECGTIRAIEGWCGLYIYPGHRFKVVRNLLTNFHLPCSSLLFFVSALAGQERIMAAYREAIRANYRFYSYGDAMLIMS